MSETEKSACPKEVVLKDSLLMHNNMFWTSTLEFHLEGLLNRAYENPKKRQMIRSWLAGAALGTVLAFMMAVIGLSLPEMIILRKVLTIRLISVFIGVVGFGILVVGYLFNLLNI